MAATVIGQGITIEGEVSATEEVVVAGVVRGKLTVDGQVTIEPDGSVTIEAPQSTGTDTFNIGAGFEFSHLGIDHVNPAAVSYAPAAYDNIGVEAAPEPASLALFGLGVLALLRRRH